jgi:hypothetical protein
MISWFRRPSAAACSNTRPVFMGLASVVSLKKSCTLFAARVRCAHAKDTPPQTADAD